VLTVLRRPDCRGRLCRTIRGETGTASILPRMFGGCRASVHDVWRWQAVGSETGEDQHMLLAATRIHVLSIFAPSIREPAPSRCETSNAGTRRTREERTEK
jgi:hypothetical protein